MIDYHLHLWSHSESDVSLQLEQVAAYCEEATRQGISEVALTEHAFRFADVRSVVGDFWTRTGHEPSSSLMADYFDFHARNSLDAYVDFAQRAQDSGLPVKVGLEVDLYSGQMARVGEWLDNYPFDVLIGSVHWLDTWQFDDLDNANQMAQWSERNVDDVWQLYGAAMDELLDANVVDVIAHPDVIKVTGVRPRDEHHFWAALSEHAARAGVSVELSSAGWFKPVNEPYPAPGLLDEFVARGVTFTMASDAHRRERVGARSDELATMLEDRGVHEVATYSRRRRAMVPLRSEPWRPSLT